MTTPSYIKIDLGELRTCIAVYDHENQIQYNHSRAELVSKFLVEYNDHWFNKFLTRWFNRLPLDESGAIDILTNKTGLSSPYCEYQNIPAYFNYGKSELHDLRVLVNHGIPGDYVHLSSEFSYLLKYR